MPGKEHSIRKSGREDARIGEGVLLGARQGTQAFADGVSPRLALTPSTTTIEHWPTMTM
jgi:hypothetical protein